MNTSMKITCPECSGTGDFTTGDRHAGTNMDVCKRCEGTGRADPLTGQTAATSAGTSFNRQTQEQIWAVALDQASKGDSRMFDRLVAETGAAFKLLPEDQQEAMLKYQRDNFRPGPRGDRQAQPETNSWQETARRYASDADFYRGIVQQVGELFGDKVKTSDDGSVQDQVLALKVFDAVRELMEEANVLRRQRMAPDRERELLEANNRYLERARAAERSTFQDRNLTFINEVAGDDPTDLTERRDRFLEEALELAQALGVGKQAAHELVHYVWERPVGEPTQEMGGTMVTLAGLASFVGLDMVACGEAELTRCQTPEVVAKIRAKRATRVRGSVLPGTGKVYSPAPEVKGTIRG